MAVMTPWEQGQVDVGGDTSPLVPPKTLAPMPLWGWEWAGSEQWLPPSSLATTGRWGFFCPMLSGLLET